MNPVLTLDHVSYSYHTPSGETPALKDVSFSVRPGSFTSIAGPSGCGKSTLGRGVCKLENLTSGHVYLDGEDITEYLSLIHI